MKLRETAPRRTVAWSAVRRSVRVVDRPGRRSCPDELNRRRGAHGPDGLGAPQARSVAPDEGARRSQWLDEHEYLSLAQLRGSMNMSRCPTPPRSSAGTTCASCRAGRPDGSVTSQAQARAQARRRAAAGSGRRSESVRGAGCTSGGRPSRARRRAGTPRPARRR